MCRKGIGMSKYLIENLFGVEGWNIAWYGVIIAVGMVLGVSLAIYRVRRQYLKEDLIFDFIFNFQGTAKELILIGVKK